MVTKYISPQDPTVPLEFPHMTAVESGGVWEVQENWRTFTAIRRSVTTQEMFQLKDVDDMCNCTQWEGYDTCSGDYHHCDMTLPADEVEDFWMRKGWSPTRGDLEWDKKERGVA